MGAAASGAPTVAGAPVPHVARWEPMPGGSPGPHAFPEQPPGPCLSSAEPAFHTPEAALDGHRIT